MNDSSRTDPPVRLGSSATSLNGSWPCPHCGTRVGYVLGTLGGGFAYQPCGCPGGKLIR